MDFFKMVNKLFPKFRLLYWLLTTITFPTINDCRFSSLLRIVVLLLSRKEGNSRVE